MQADDSTLEQAKQFKYLSTQITEDARLDTEINNRFNVAKIEFNSMHKSYKPNNCHLYAIYDYWIVMSSRFWNKI